MKNNEKRLLCPSKLPLLQLSLWFETGVIQKLTEIVIKWVIFFTGVSFELDKWPWRTIGYLLYTPRSFVHHFIATCELKLELSSRNAEIVAKLAVFGSRGLEIWRMTLKIVGHLFHVNRSFVHHFTAICEFWKWSYLPENLKSGQIGYFWPAWHGNFADDLKNYNIENAIWHTL